MVSAGPPTVEISCSLRDAMSEPERPQLVQLRPFMQADTAAAEKARAADALAAAKAEADAASKKLAADTAALRDLQAKVRQPPVCCSGEALRCIRSLGARTPARLALQCVQRIVLLSRCPLSPVFCHHRLHRPSS